MSDQQDATREIVVLSQAIASKHLSLDVCPAMKKSIEDIVLCAYGATEDEVDEIEALLFRVAAGEQVAVLGRAVKAEAIYDIQQSGLWEKLKNPSTDELYRWYEFRELLSDEFGISVSSIGNYLGDVRFARQVLKIPEGAIQETGGLEPLRKIQEVAAGTDARGTDDIAITVRPVSVRAEKELVKRYGPAPEVDGEKDWCPHFQQLYRDSFAFHGDDPSAVKRTAFELGESARQVNGRPSVTWSWLDESATALAWRAEYPGSVDEQGAARAGDVERGVIELESDLLPIVRDSLERKLHIQEVGDG